MAVNRIIIGANFGDEGKGSVVAHYAKHAQGKVLNVLTNGGSQRAHNIETETGRYKFQHFGSGTYYGADNLFGPEFILNPMQFALEYEEKKEMLGKVTLFRSPLCMWSTPYDMMANQIIELHKRSGSCGMGIWETVLRYRSGLFVRFDEFMQMPIEAKHLFLDRVRDYFSNRLGHEIPSEYSQSWNDSDLKVHFINDCAFLHKMTRLSHEIQISDYAECIYENGQGLLLNDNGTDDGGTTPSCTGSAHVRQMLRDENVCLHYVSRPYLTKHGGYTFKGESNAATVSEDIREDWANPFNEWQRDFRYGILDPTELKNRILADANGLDFTLELTHCDEMDNTNLFSSLFEHLNTYNVALVK